MSDWKPYLDGRLIKREDGFVVIKPADAEPGVPLCCPTCDTLMRTSDDASAFSEFQCCHLCALTWAHPRRKEWQQGWRPSTDEVSVSVAQRPPLKVILVLD